MLRKLLQWQTKLSFDYQWRHLPEGDAMLSDRYFKENVKDILVNEMLCVNKEWFLNKEVLDAGCGLGRWALGFLELGCRVTAVDVSESACRIAKINLAKYTNVRIFKENLLNLSRKAVDRKYDVVFSFGVLHHTGDMYKAMKNICSLCKDDGIIFVYLYGKETLSPVDRLKLESKRLILSILPHGTKKWVLRKMFSGNDIHQVFDRYSPLINTRFDFLTIRTYLQSLGFTHVVKTIEHTELFIRAAKDNSSAHPHFMPFPQRPYWFERYAK